MISLLSLLLVGKCTLHELRLFLLIVPAVLLGFLLSRFTGDTYINEIYMGRGYGFQSASRAYFGKNVTDVDVAEAALLAGRADTSEVWPSIAAAELRAAGVPRETATPRISSISARVTGW